MVDGLSTDRPVIRTEYYTRIMNAYRYSPLYIPFLNGAIRTVQRGMSAWDKRRVAEFAKDKKQQIDEWYGRHQFFFGFGVGRSGTTFLANFLGSTARNAIVLHEANINDLWDYPTAIHDRDRARHYLETYRVGEIYRRVSGYSFRVYGEINPFLRRHCVAFKEVLPRARYFQLVRNGKKTVRSLMSRELLGHKDPLGKYVFPAKGDPYRESWKDMSRFERLCWMWMEDNRLLRSQLGHPVKFEMVRADYDYFKERLLDHIGLEVSLADWERNVRSVTNRTPSHAFPRYEDWSRQDKATFERICGDEMSKYGYS